MCRLTTCASARTPVSTSLATERAPRRRHSRRRGSAPPRARDDIDAAVDAVDEDDYTKWQRSPQSAAWERMASKDPSGSSYRVGAKPLDEKFLSELMLALLRNHAKGLKADVLLKKVQSNMELDGYKSVLVGIGRMERWELAREVIDFVKAGGRERGDEVLTSNWFMALATRRLEEKAYDACCDVFQYMKEFGSVPSGETIEVFAKLTVRFRSTRPAPRDRNVFALVDDYTPSKTPSFGSESH